MFKPLLSRKFLLLLLGIISMAAPSFTQTMSIPATIRTPYGNVKSSMHVPAPWMNGYQYNDIESRKYLFTVVLRGGSTFVGKGRINITDSVHSITLKNDQESRVFYPYETTEIYRLGRDGEKITGIATDSCWLFKTDTGRINFYSFVAEPGTPFITAIERAGTGEILPFYAYYVKEMVAENEKALKLAKKGKLYKALIEYNKASM